jgi:hypothetical protein
MCGNRANLAYSRRNSSTGAYSIIGRSYAVELFHVTMTRFACPSTSPLAQRAPQLRGASGRTAAWYISIIYLSFFALVERKKTINEEKARSAAPERRRRAVGSTKDAPDSHASGASSPLCCDPRRRSPRRFSRPSCRRSSRPCTAQTPDYQRLLANYTLSTVRALQWCSVAG